MPIPQAGTKIIQQGAWCNVVIYDEDNNAATLGLVSGASYQENFNVTPAQVIGFFGPIALDSQNYSCTVTINIFIPLNYQDAVTVPYLDGGTTTLTKLIKTRSDIAIDGYGTAFNQIDFVDLGAGVVYNSFGYTVVSNSGTNIGAAQYVTGNVQLMSLERIK